MNPARTLKLAALVTCSFSIVMPGCHCREDSSAASSSDAGSTRDGGGTADGNGATANGCKAPTALTLAPADFSATVTSGGTFSKAYTVQATYANGTSADITGGSFFSASDPALGSFNGAQFNWGGNHGGQVIIKAMNCGVTGTTTLTLKLAVSDGTTGTDPATAATQFTGPDSTKTACAPTLLYPPDNVLIPPNTNVIEVHFQAGGASNTLFELSFTNAMTDVRVYTRCTSTTDPAQGMSLNGGCVYQLTQAEWDYIARSNADRDPVQVQVRAVGCDGSSVSSSNKRALSFAKDDLVGTLYYWASMRVTLSGKGYNSGGIYRYDFGLRGQSADPVLTPNTDSVNSNHLCIGCHDVSRDGRQMIFDADDNDDDDEYSDVSTAIYDIAKDTTVPPSPIVKNNTAAFSPGFHAWNREATLFLLSDGDDAFSTRGAFQVLKADGTKVGFTQSGQLRGTSPAWSPDDSQVAFVVPTMFYPPKSSSPSPNGADLWFTGASLYSAPWDSSTKTIGTATKLLSSDGTTNYFYPTYSPDGTLLAFNFVPSGPQFHNPLARVEVIASGQTPATAVDLAKLNTTASATNSWPRFSPFIQQYKGHSLLWLTFSSTRDYGLRIQNAGAGNCYPNESPNGFPVFTASGQACARTQVWMAAIDLDAAAVGHGTDVSWPAFWLPFQDLATNNHQAQWAQQSFRGTCAKDEDCNTGGATGRCCFFGELSTTGACATCLAPYVPPATCSTNANCPSDQCCNGNDCGACGADAGTSTGCKTCLDCSGQACNGGVCGKCTTSDQCCAPMICDTASGTCQSGPN